MKPVIEVEGNQVIVPREVLDFFHFADAVFVPFTPQQEEMMISLRKARVAMGSPEYRFGERHAQCREQEKP